MKPTETWKMSMDEMLREQLAVAFVTLRKQIRDAWKYRHDSWWRAWIRERIVTLRRNIAVRNAPIRSQILFK